MTALDATSVELFVIIEVPRNQRLIFLLSVLMMNFVTISDDAVICTLPAPSTIWAVTLSISEDAYFNT